MSGSSTPVYTNRLRKAGAHLSDTRSVLAVWDLDQSTRENLDRVVERNLLAKTSRQRLLDLVQRTLRPRYFEDEDVGRALVTLTQAGAPNSWLDALFYFFTAQDDRTLRDLVTETIYTRRMAGYFDVPRESIEAQLRAWVATGQTVGVWNEGTINRVARNALTSLRDFGVLEGKQTKRLRPVYLPLPAFALIARWLMTRLGSGKQVVYAEDWRLFFLTVEGVEGMMVEAHQHDMLAYHAAGSIVRLEFPAATMEEMARALITH